MGIDSKNIVGSKNYQVQIRKSVEQLRLRTNAIALLRTPTTLTTRIREHFMVSDLGASMAAVTVAHFPSEISMSNRQKNYLLL